MAGGAGVLRSRESLGRTLGRLVELRLLTTEEPQTAAWEATNLHTIASFVAAAETCCVVSRTSKPVPPTHSDTSAATCPKSPIHHTVGETQLPGPLPARSEGMERAAPMVEIFTHLRR